jgi:hypothetical protein
MKWDHDRHPNTNEWQNKPLIFMKNSGLIFGLYPKKILEKVADDRNTA